MILLKRNDLFFRSFKPLKIVMLFSNILGLTASSTIVALAYLGFGFCILVKLLSCDWRVDFSISLAGGCYTPVCQGF